MHLFKLLVHGGFLASVRDPVGGYRLNRRLAVVSVADVICAVDIDTAGPGQNSRGAAVQYSEGESAITAELWSGLDDYLHDYLRTVSLESVLAGAVVVRVPQVPGDSRVRDRPQSSLSPMAAL